MPQCALWESAAVRTSAFDAGGDASYFTAAWVVLKKQQGQVATLNLLQEIVAHDFTRTRFGCFLFHFEAHACLAIRVFAVYVETGSLCITRRRSRYHPGVIANDRGYQKHARPRISAPHGTPLNCMLNPNTLGICDARPNRSREGLCSRGL